MNLYYAKVKSLPSTLCQNVVKEKNLISSCFRSNPNVCMIEICIVLYKLIRNNYVYKPNNLKKNGSFVYRENLQYKKTADSVLLSLFMRTNVKCNNHHAH